jgi:hypothetical protein
MHRFIHHGNSYYNVDHITKITDMGEKKARVMFSEASGLGDIVMNWVYLDDLVDNDGQEEKVVVPVTYGWKAISFCSWEEGVESMSLRDVIAFRGPINDFGDGSTLDPIDITGCEGANVAVISPDGKVFDKKDGLNAVTMEEFLKIYQARTGSVVGRTREECERLLEERTRRKEIMEPVEETVERESEWMGR